MHVHSFQGFYSIRTHYNNHIPDELAYTSEYIRGKPKSAEGLCWNMPFHIVVDPFITAINYIFYASHKSFARRLLIAQCAPLPRYFFDNELNEPVSLSFKKDQSHIRRNGSCQAPRIKLDDKSLDRLWTGLIQVIMHVNRQYIWFCSTLFSANMLLYWFQSLVRY